MTLPRRGIPWRVGRVALIAIVRIMVGLEQGAEAMVGGSGAATPFLRANIGLRKEGEQSGRRVRVSGQPFHYRPVLRTTAAAAAPLLKAACTRPGGDGQVQRLIIQLRIVARMRRRIRVHHLSVVVLVQHSMADFFLHSVAVPCPVL